MSSNAEIHGRIVPNLRHPGLESIIACTNNTSRNTSEFEALPLRSVTYLSMYLRNGVPIVCEFVNPGAAAPPPAVMKRKDRTTDGSGDPTTVGPIEQLHLPESNLLPPSVYEKTDLVGQHPRHHQPYALQASCVDKSLTSVITFCPTVTDPNVKLQAIQVKVPLPGGKVHFCPTNSTIGFSVTGSTPETAKSKDGDPSWILKTGETVKSKKGKIAVIGPSELFIFVSMICPSS